MYKADIEGGDRRSENEVAKLSYVSEREEAEKASLEPVAGDECVEC
jgi:hypothetical protein